jgi:hypothetical protein
MAKKNPTEIAIVYQKGVLVLFKKNNHFQFLGCAELSGIDIFHTGVPGVTDTLRINMRI